MLWVFSTATTRVGARYGSSGLKPARTAAAVKRPSPGSTWVCAPASAASAPDSNSQQWASLPMRTSSPGRVCARSAIWLAMVPLGTSSAASVPSRSATRSCSARTVGSSPYTSSPTSASAMARRIPAVGRVTVSERRSIAGASDAIAAQGTRSGTPRAGSADRGDRAWNGSAPVGAGLALGRILRGIGVDVDVVVVVVVDLDGDGDVEVVATFDAALRSSS
jgi:hypothetical protein